MDDQRINTSDAEPGEVLISLAHGNGNDGTRSARLTVEEARSGEVLVRVTLSPEEFAAILAGSITKVSGARVTPDPYRLGRRMENTSVDIRQHGDDGARMAETERWRLLAEGWDTVQVDRTNFGFRVGAYRWIDDNAAPSA